MRACIRPAAIAVLAIVTACHSSNNVTPDGSVGDDDGGGSDASADTGGSGFGPGVYAYIAGTSVTIADVTDPTNITLPTSYQTHVVTAATLPSSSHAGHTFATEVTQTNNLVVYDTSQPGMATQLGSVALGGGLPYELHQVDNHLFVGEIGQLEIIDITNPTAPLSIGSFPVTGAVRGIALHDHFAYLAVTGMGLVIVDISTLTAPTLVSTTAVPHLGPDGPWSITYAAGYAYLALPFVGVLIFDVTTPATPVPHGTIAGAASSTRELVVAGDYAYLANLGALLQVADIHDPDHPGIIATAPLHYPGSAIALAGTRLYVAGDNAAEPPLGDSAIDVFDLSTPAAPAPLGAVTMIVGGTYTALEIATVTSQ